jgi:hypothetical protein
VLSSVPGGKLAALLNDLKVIIKPKMSHEEVFSESIGQSVVDDMSICQQNESIAARKCFNL